VGLSEGTRETVRDLRLIGGQHGRLSSLGAGGAPFPDAGPGFGSIPDAAVLDFPGVPSIRVRIDGCLKDTVVVEEVISFVVPRRDTTAVVEAVLAGRARLRRDVGSRWNAVRALLMTPFARSIVSLDAVLVVPIPGRASYEQLVPVPPPGGGWLTSVPAEV